MTDNQTSAAFPRVVRKNVPAARKTSVEILSTETFQPHCSGFREVKAEKIGPCLSQAEEPVNALSRLDDHIIRPDFYDCKRIVARFFAIPLPDPPTKNSCIKLLQNSSAVKMLKPVK